MSDDEPLLPHISIITGRYINFSSGSEDVESAQYGSRNAQNGSRTAQNGSRTAQNGSRAARGSRSKPDDDVIDIEMTSSRHASTSSRGPPPVTTRHGSTGSRHSRHGSTSSGPPVPLPHRTASSVHIDMSSVAADEDFLMVLPLVSHRSSASSSEDFESVPYTQSALNIHETRLQMTSPSSSDDADTPFSQEYEKLRLSLRGRKSQGETSAGDFIKGNDVITPYSDVIKDTQYTSSDDDIISSPYGMDIDKGFHIEFRSSGESVTSDSSDVVSGVISGHESKEIGNVSGGEAYGGFDAEGPASSASASSDVDEFDVTFEGATISRPLLPNGPDTDSEFEAFLNDQTAHFEKPTSKTTFISITNTKGDSASGDRETRKAIHGSSGKRFWLEGLNLGFDRSEVDKGCCRPCRNLLRTVCPCDKSSKVSNCKDNEIV